MKALLPLAISTALIATGLAEPTAPAHPAPVACEQAGKTIPQFVTRERYTFIGATLLAKFPDGLLFKLGKMAPPSNRVHAALEDCIVMVPQECLPENLRKAVGGFNVADVEAASKQRHAALEAGNKDQFPADLTAGAKVQWYEGDQDPFGYKDNGRAQSWEEYLVALAKEKAALEKAAGPPPKIVIIEELGGTEWSWGSGGELELRKDGSARHTRWDKPGTWEKLVDGRILLKQSVHSFTITLTDHGTGKVIASDGKETTVTLKRGGKKPDPKPTGRLK